jgi:hypothetical protein
LDKRREKGIVKRERTRRALTVEVREELEAAQSISLKQAMDEFLTAKAAKESLNLNLIQKLLTPAFLCTYFLLCSLLHGLGQQEVSVRSHI